MPKNAGQEETQNPSVEQSTPEIAEAIEKIKQPPSIDETLRNQSPEELMSNPMVVPEMLNEPGDLRGDLQPDE
jgi:hypothetical protein